MVKKIAANFLLLLITVSLTAQDLYMPRNVQQAYINGSRSKDGLPGKNYFQNKAVYNITLDAMPPNREIQGKEEIAYTNNSTDTLTYLIIRTIQNIHKPGAIRYADVKEQYLTNGLIIDELVVNNEVKTALPNTPGTFQVIELSKPMSPKTTINLSVKWHYRISLESAREGMIDSTTFFMAYAYPSICVYDDYYGWDMVQFNDLQEFYYDFNDYTVTLNVPKNYFVWGTGDLINANEVLQKTYVERLNNSIKSDDVIKIVSAEDLRNKNVTLQNSINSWKFKVKNIQDVAYAVSDHFVWDASSVVVDNKTKLRISVQSAYNDTSSHFHNMVRWSNYSLKWFSTELPGVPYPFPKMTVVQGYADMEFPMLVNGNAAPDSMQTRRVAAEHEIAHSWFPFYMGINESRYAFMDEGWASFLEASISYSYRSKEDAAAIDTRDAAGWSNTPFDEMDLPIITPATMLNGQSYQLNAYTKPMLAYMAVQDLLGDDLFKKCLHEYMKRWNGKHPIPWDFFNTFNNVSGINLNYFWKACFFESNHIDMALGKITKIAGVYTVSINNIGGCLVPFNLVIQYADGTVQTLHQSPAIWARNQKKAAINLKTAKKIKTITLNTGVFADADKENNYIKN